MAKKIAGNSKSPSKQSKSKADASGSGSAAATDSATQTPRPHSTNTNENTNPDAPAPAIGLGLKFRLLFFLFPLLQMLWTAEAPVRPFSAVRTFSREKDLETGKEVVTVKKEVIEPRILVVLADVGDVGYVAPTVGILENEPRKEHATVHVLTLSSGVWDGVEASDGSEGKTGKETTAHENWAKAWDVLGVQERRRFLVDLPEREGAWDPDVVADTVLQYVVEYNIDTILTFAERGATNDPRRKAVSQGVTSFIHSPRLSEASKNSASSPNRITPRAFFLRSSVLPLSDLSLPFDLPIPLGPLHPVIQHFTLLYHALRKSPEPDQSSGAGEGSVLPSPPTVFISDVKTYYKSWRAVLQLQGEIGPDVMAKWAVGRDMWVNEWVELEV